MWNTLDGMPCEVILWHGIHRDCHNTELHYNTWLQHCKVNASNEDKNCELEELQGHMDCPHIFGKFLKSTNMSPPLAISQ
jgi:hypothetical protein